MATRTLRQQIFKRNELRRVVSKYAALIETPDGPVTLPASANFAVKSLAGNVANVTALTVAGYAGMDDSDPPEVVTSKEIKVPALAVDGIHRIGRLQQGAVVTVSEDFELLLETGLGRFETVGEA